MTEANVDRLSKSLKETYRASILKNIGQAQAEAAKFGRLVDKLPTGDLPWHIWYPRKSLIKHWSSAFLRRCQDRERARIRRVRAREVMGARHPAVMKRIRTAPRDVGIVGLSPPDVFINLVRRPGIKGNRLDSKKLAILAFSL